MLLTSWLRSFRARLWWFGRQKTKRRKCPQRFVSSLQPLEKRTLLSGVTAVIDAFHTGTETSLSSSRSVLDNDQGVSSSATANLVQTVAHGSLTLNGDGTFSYTPSSGYTGVDSFQYSVSDGSETSNTVTVTLAVGDVAGDETSTAHVLSSANNRIAGRIGDGSQGANDVDLYRVTLSAGQTLKVDIDAAYLDDGTPWSSLDSHLRVFDEYGYEVASNGNGTDPQTGVGSTDSTLTYRASSSGGTYYIGVSGAGNEWYYPGAGGSGSGASTGDYELAVEFVTPPPLVYTQSSYSLSIPLDTSTSTVLATLAVDNEEGSVSFYDSGAWPFSVDSSTGAIRVSDPSYLSVGQSYSFTVTAYDQYQSVSTTVTIQVTAPLNQPPAFGQSSYTYKVSFDAVSNLLVDTLTATDPENNTLSFSDNGNAYPFYLDSSGQLRLSDNSYLSAGQTYSFTATVYDTYGQDTATITIHIVNERPTFLSPDSSAWEWDEGSQRYLEHPVFAFTLDESIPVGTAIGAISAQGFEDSPLTYSISTGPFEVDSTTGEITTREALSFAAHATYRLSLTATDSMGNSSTAFVDVSIVSVSPPVIANLALEHPDPSFQVPVTSIPTIVGDVQDAALGDAGQSTVQYSYVIEVDRDANGSVDQTISLDSNSGFTYGAGWEELAYGRHTMAFRAVKAISDGRTVSGEWSTITFTYIPNTASASQIAQDSGYTPSGDYGPNFESNSPEYEADVSFENGTTTVTLTGSGLSGLTTVSFGGVQASSIVYQADGVVLTFAGPIASQSDLALTKGDGTTRVVSASDVGFRDVSRFLAYNAAIDTLQASNNTRDDALGASLVDQVGALGDASFNADQGAINAFRQSELQAAQQNDNSDTAAAGTLTSAQQQAAATRTAADLQAQDTYHQALQSANDTKNAAIQAAGAAYSAAVASLYQQYHPSSYWLGVDPWNDPDYQSAMTAAQDAYNAASQAAYETREEAVDDAIEAFNQAVQPLYATYITAVQSAQATFTQAEQDAQTAYEAAEAAIQQTFSDAISSAISTRDAALTANQSAADSAQAAAYQAYQSALASNQASYDAGAATIIDGLIDQLTAANTDWSGLYSSLQSTFDQQWNAFQQTGSQTTLTSIVNAISDFLRSGADGIGAASDEVADAFHAAELQLNSLAVTATLADAQAGVDMAHALNQAAEELAVQNAAAETAFISAVAQAEEAQAVAGAAAAYAAAQAGHAAEKARSLASADAAFQFAQSYAPIKSTHDVAVGKADVEMNAAMSKASSIYNVASQQAYAQAVAKWAQELEDLYGEDEGWSGNQSTVDQAYANATYAAGESAVYLVYVDAVLDAEKQWYDDVSQPWITGELALAQNAKSEVETLAPQIQQYNDSLASNAQAYVAAVAPAARQQSEALAASNEALVAAIAGKLRELADTRADNALADFAQEANLWLTAVNGLADDRLNEVLDGNSSFVEGAEAIADSITNTFTGGEADISTLLADAGPPGQPGNLQGEFWGAAGSGEFEEGWLDRLIARGANRTLSIGDIRELGHQAAKAEILLNNIYSMLKNLQANILESIQIGVEMLPGGGVASVLVKSARGDDIGWLDIAGAVGDIATVTKVGGVWKVVKNADNVSDATLISRVASAIAEQCDRVCFSPETLVSTATGLKPIGMIEPGEQVHAFDFEQGTWVLSEVQIRHDNRYSGLMVELQVGPETIRATAGHPFWVVRGEELSDRPISKRLAPREDVGQSLKGRWVDSHELRPGDLLVCRDGVERLVEAVNCQEQRDIRVCNLTIAVNHSFAVGGDGVLAHNQGWCDILRDKIGNAPKKLTDYLAKNGLPTSRLHGHHIVQKGLNLDIYKKVKNLSEAALSGKSVSEQATWYIGKSQELLELADVSLLATKDEVIKLGKESLHNLCWAINGDRGIHSAAYNKAVYSRLKAAYDAGASAADKQAKVQEALAEMKRILHGGGIFW